MDNKPTVLDILLTLRNLEELLMDYVEENSPSEKIEIEKALENRETDSMPATIDNIYTQLLYIEDAVHCISKDNALAAINAMAQYKQFFK